VKFEAVSVDWLLRSGSLDLPPYFTDKLYQDINGISGWLQEYISLTSQQRVFARRRSFISIITRFKKFMAKQQSRTSIMLFGSWSCESYRRPLKSKSAATLYHITTSSVAHLHIQRLFLKIYFMRCITVMILI
jgi:hypothetical protein